MAGGGQGQVERLPADPHLVSQLNVLLRGHSQVGVVIEDRSDSQELSIVDLGTDRMVMRSEEVGENISDCETFLPERLSGLVESSGMMTHSPVL